MKYSFGCIVLLRSVKLFNPIDEYMNLKCNISQKSKMYFKRVETLVPDNERQKRNQLKKSKQKLRTIILNSIRICKIFLAR